jgi:23S rRNA (uracil1939-C5)-methyltransferase
MADSGKAKTPRPGQRADLTIDRVDSKGRGQAQLEGYTVSMRGGVPGDRVLVGLRKVRHRRREAEARILDVVAPGVRRQAAVCEHFGTCGGCLWQDLAYSDQLALKSQIVESCLGRAGVDIKFAPPLEAPSAFRYRNKMEFSFGESEEGPTIGLHASGRFDHVFDLSACHLQSDVSNAIVSFTRDFVRSRGLSSYDLRKHTGLMRFLTVRDGKHTGEVMVALTTSTEPFVDAESFASELVEQFPEVASVIHSINGRKAQVATGDEERVLAGKSTIEDRLGRFQFDISLGSFFQPNTFQAERMFEQVVTMTEIQPDDRMLDVYCGTGGISFFLSEVAQDVLGIESSEAAIKDAVRNSAQNGVEGCQFMAGPAEVLLSQLRNRGERFDVVVTDPPRPGMHAKALAALGELAPRRIVYVSCNPQALAEDLIRLRAFGYTATAAQVVDMLPQTPHCEVLVRLDKDTGANERSR